jgi:hypothetical protein
MKRREEVVEGQKMSSGMGKIVEGKRKWKGEGFWKQSGSLLMEEIWIKIQV